MKMKRSVKKFTKFSDAATPPPPTNAKPTKHLTKCPFTSFLTRQRTSNPSAFKPYIKEIKTSNPPLCPHNFPLDECDTPCFGCQTEDYYQDPEWKLHTFPGNVPSTLQTHHTTHHAIIAQNAPSTSQPNVPIIVQPTPRRNSVPKTIRPKRQRPQLRLVDFQPSLLFQPVYCLPSLLFQPSLLFDYGDLSSSSETESERTFTSTITN